MMFKSRFWRTMRANSASPSAWTLIREGANTVLRGTNHNFADISGNGWDDYILKLRFKRVRGSAQINFRNNFLTPEEPQHRYIIRLEEEGNRLVFAKGLDERKGIYQDLQESPASYKTGWHVLEARSYQDIINIYLDGDLLIKYKDTQKSKCPGPGVNWITTVGICTNPHARQSPFFNELEGSARVFAWTFGHRRAGVVHSSVGEALVSPTYKIIRHMDTFFNTVVTDKGGTVIENGHLTALDNPRVRKVAAKYGDPDKLLKELWIPAVKGVNTP